MASNWLQTLAAFGKGYTDAQRVKDVEAENKRRYDEQAAENKRIRDKSDFDKGFANAADIFTNPNIPPDIKRKIAQANLGSGWEAFYNTLTPNAQKPVTPGAQPPSVQMPPYAPIDNYQWANDPVTVHRGPSKVPQYLRDRLNAEVAPASQQPGTNVNTPNYTFGQQNGWIQPAIPASRQAPEGPEDETVSRPPLTISPGLRSGLIVPVNPNLPTPDDVARLRANAAQPEDVFDQIANWESPAARAARESAESRQRRLDEQELTKNKMDFLQNATHFTGDSSLAKAYGELAPMFGFEKGLNLYSPTQEEAARSNIAYRNTLVETLPENTRLKVEQLELKKQIASDQKERDMLTLQQQLLIANAKDATSRRGQDITARGQDIAAKTAANALAQRAEAANVASQDKRYVADTAMQNRNAALALQARKESASAQRGTKDLKGNPKVAQQFYDISQAYLQKSGITKPSSNSFLNRVTSKGGGRFAAWEIKKSVNMMRAQGMTDADIEKKLRSKGVR